MLELAVLARAAPTGGVAARLLGVAKDTLVAVGAGTARKVAAAVDFGDFGSADDLPAGIVACRCIVLGFLSMHPMSLVRPFGVGHHELGLKVEPVGPEWQCLRALPVDVLTDDDRRGVCVVIAATVHLDLDDLAKPGHQLGNQRLAEGCHSLSAQPKDSGGPCHVRQQIGGELANARGTVLVRDNQHHASFVAESVNDFVAFAHGGQDVLGRASKFFWQVVGDIHAHSQVAWERLPVPEISSVIHGTHGGACGTATARDRTEVR